MSTGKEEKQQKAKPKQGKQMPRVFAKHKN